MRFRCITFIAALILAASCGESDESMCTRVFNLALTQYKAMDTLLGESELPRTTENDSLITSKPSWWCAGFYPGSLWYIYLQTGDTEVKALAEKNTHKLYQETQKARSHDIGFVTNCSYGNAWRITGDTCWRKPVIDAARALCSRFNPAVGATMSWNTSPKRPQWKYPVIIDNMMNLELLMEAHKLCGTDSLREIAITHARTTAKNHFRPDFTCWHVVDYDPDNGSVRMKCTHQGYSDDSAWARGQSWGLYGYTMMYRESGEPEFLKQAESIAGALIPRLPEDGIPYWDYDDPAAPSTYRDASAGAIMASALLELSRLSTDTVLADLCQKTARRQLKTLCSADYLAPEGSNGHFLLRHSVGNMPGGSEVDVPLTYADYYLLEALLRLSGKL
ncbi:MAG: glycoside hydrolase family 88 protein [Bacteroidales bacterium]|nr:glycoside hydrolase family 88 protein [Bacteroidales bacterium]